MKEQLIYYIRLIGMSGVLKELSEIADEESKKVRFEENAKRWAKTSIHLHQLSGKVFLRRLRLSDEG